jgi:8-oxo-dGTP pyrophosphatase MutT (NUDIX family)
VSDLADIIVTPVSSLEARRLDEDWPWAAENRRLIKSYWAQLTAAKPALYNGRVLVRRRQSLSEGCLALDYVETDYASFIAHRDHGFPDRNTGNSFSMAALRSSDGAYILGRMADHTANAGKVYFPAGTPDPDDVLPDGTVDLAGSVLRELEEETGLKPDEVAVSAGWIVVFAGGRTAMMRELRAPVAAEALRRKILGFLACEARPELSDICVVRSIEDINPEAMPPFMQAFLRFALAQPISGSRNAPWRR